MIHTLHLYMIGDHPPPQVEVSKNTCMFAFQAIQAIFQGVQRVGRISVLTIARIVAVAKKNPTLGLSRLLL